MTTPTEHYFNEITSGTATSILRNEHEAVLSVLDALDKATFRLATSQEVPLEFFDDVLEFLTVFVDKCHHSKEEEVLFPLLGQGGIPVEGGPIGQMLLEHEQGREYIRQMQQGLALLRKNIASGREQMIMGARNYGELLRNHILKENRVLFMMADSLLQSAAQEEVARQFDEIENNKIGAGTHERLHGKIDVMIATANRW